MSKSETAAVREKLAKDLWAKKIIIKEIRAGERPRSFTYQDIEEKRQEIERMGPERHAIMRQDYDDFLTKQWAEYPHLLKPGTKLPPKFEDLTNVAKAGVQRLLSMDEDLERTRRALEDTKGRAESKRERQDIDAKRLYRAKLAELQALEQPEYIHQQVKDAAYESEKAQRRLAEERAASGKDGQEITR